MQFNNYKENPKKKFTLIQFQFYRKYSSHYLIFCSFCLLNLVEIHKNCIECTQFQNETKSHRKTHPPKRKKDNKSTTNQTFEKITENY